MTKLRTLINDQPVDLRRGAPDTRIRGITEDSREVTPGAMFVARPGTVTDGRRYIRDAVERGAAAVLTDDATELPADLLDVVAHLAATDAAEAAGHLAERFHGDPSRRLALVGITGTNGKTTVAHLVKQLLDGAGARCGLIGTVEIDCGDGPEPASLTTPDSVTTSRLLRRMVETGCRAAVMEVSSHALDQRRTAGLSFAGGVFTNLSGDHLDYHGTMEAYAAAKATLFAQLPADGFAVVNADDPASAEMIGRCAARVVTTGLDDAGAAARAAIDSATITSTRVTFDGPWGSIDAALPLAGCHNVANALQATAVAHALGVARDDLAAGLSRCAAPPGRLERVTPLDHAFQVLVDYAHTDDALDNALRALRPLVPGGGRLCVVFGCGGDRDATKRPRMAAAACRWADDVVITSDNPRTEDPRAIVDEIAAGVPAERLDDTVRLVDRTEAIRVAIDRAGPGDVVLIAGKGHETYQIVGTATRPFDDRLVARHALDQRPCAGVQA